MKIEDFKNIIYEKEDNGICTITINAPKRRNAFTFVSFLEMEYAIADMEKDDNTKLGHNSLDQSKIPVRVSGEYPNNRIFTQIEKR